MDERPDVENNLKLGRGKRPKLHNQTVSMRMSASTKKGLECIADSYEITYGSKPWIAGLLEKIGNGELMVVPAPPLLQSEAAEPVQMVNPKDAVKARLQKRYGASTSATPQHCSIEDDTNATSNPSVQSSPTLSSLSD